MNIIYSKGSFIIQGVFSCLGENCPLEVHSYFKHYWLILKKFNFFAESSCDFCVILEDRAKLSTSIINVMHCHLIN